MAPSFNLLRSSRDPAAAAVRSRTGPRLRLDREPKSAPDVAHVDSEGDTGMAWIDRTRERFTGGSITGIILIVLVVLAVIYALFLRP